jgi:phosphoribosylaminoimidazole-succinocarboxamide synthase
MMTNSHQIKSYFVLSRLIIGLFGPGMVKNQKLSANILTPTTKAADHDVPVTPDEVFSIAFNIFPRDLRVISYDKEMLLV